MLHSQPSLVSLVTPLTTPDDFEQYVTFRSRQSFQATDLFAQPSFCRPKTEFDEVRTSTVLIVTEEIVWVLAPSNLALP